MANKPPQDALPSITQSIDKALGRDAFYSFGDDGLTATASTSGLLLQLSRHFPERNRIGFCVDTPTIEEPYLVESRISELYSRATDPDNLQCIEPTWVTALTFNDIERPKFVNNRWPYFELKSEEGVTIAIQYLVSSGTIFQTWKIDFSNSRDPELHPDLPRIVAPKDLLIRNLDFVNYSNRFNEDEASAGSYKTEISDRGFMMRSHRFDTQDTGDTKDRHEVAIALFTSVFSNKKCVHFEENDGEYQLRWNDEALKNFERERKFAITIAYKLELVYSEGLPTEAPVSIEDFEGAMEGLQIQPFEEPSFTNNPHVDFLLRRNLEHILSVCSIPVTPPRQTEIQAIAFTCGDLDSHRVATAASFYCFQFLLKALGHFNYSHPRDCQCERSSQSSGNQSYICNMRSRIRKTCQGHLSWLFRETERSKGFFAPNHWVNGKEIANWENNYYLPGKSLVDTPLHLIKTGDYYKTFGEWEGPKDEIKGVVKSWVKDLDEGNKMGLYAFPRCKKEPFQNFYFTDHALIWRAVQSMEALSLQSQLRIPPEDDKKKQVEKKNLNKQPGEHQPDNVRTKKPQKPRYYSSAVIQQHIQKRFTTENPISKKRMIAVSRSPAQNRFLLRTKDTSLFRAMDLGLFDKSGRKESDGLWENRIDVWERTVDCQVRHEDNDDVGWNEPLRFALSLIMAKYEKRINLRSLEDMRRHAMSVLLQSSSPNGLFPGAMDEYHDPIIYNDELMRDTYWSISFEIPYILWEYHSQFGQSMASTEEVKRDQDLKEKDNASLLPNRPEFLLSLKEVIGQQVGNKGPTNPFGYSMKYTLPFNNVVYQENIVELFDEWLYNKPSFFDDNSSGESATALGDNVESINTHPIDTSTPPIQTHPITSTARIPTITNRVQTLKQPLYRRFFAPISQVTDASPDADGNPTTTTDKHPEAFGVVFDVPKFKKLEKDSTTMSSSKPVFTIEDVRGVMQKGRTPEDAKKRLWWFSSAEPLTGELYDLTYPSHSLSTEPSEFLDRHQVYGKFFFEDTVPVLNTWSTELHLSFYTLESTETNDERIFRFPESVNGERGKSLPRVSMSFRFDGDFFDRYWTCHFLEADPQTEMSRFNIEENVTKLLQEGTKLSETDRVKKPWRQRRVLELILFDQIINRMHNRAVKILKEAKYNIGEETDESSNKWIENEPDRMPYRAFAKTSRRFQRVQKVLQVVAGDLAENLDKIELWQNREKERQTERPRWTFNDESRYRSIISKLTVSNDHSIQELRRTYSKITNYHESLSKSLEMMRTDLDQRRAHDIQNFTYVTVVFLPLSFATGVFSMSEAPAHLTLAYMVATAVAALSVTAVVLLFVDDIKSLWQNRYDSVFVDGQRSIDSRNKTEKDIIKRGGFKDYFNPWLKRNRIKKKVSIA